MISNRIEKAFYVLLFLALYGGFYKLAPPLSKVDFTDQYSRIAASLLLSSIVFCFYARIRNKRFITKIYQYVSDNNCDAAIMKLNKAINNQPKTLWIQLEKAVVEGMNGNLSDFYASLHNISNRKKYKKQKNYCELLVIKNAIDVLLKGHCELLPDDVIESRNFRKYIVFNFQYLYNAAFSFSAQNMNDTIKYASELHNARTNFFRLFAAYVLSVAYEETCQ